MAICSSVEEGKEAIEQLKPELVFPDVEPSTGLDLQRHTNKKNPN